MPTTTTLERFIARVEDNAHAEALAEFYRPDATLSENQGTPRTRDACIESERMMFARARAVTSQCVRPALVAGDVVVIRWRFRFEWRDETVTTLDELAYQHWDGELIRSETFFYDPAQRVPKPA